MVTVGAEVGGFFVGDEVDTVCYLVVEGALVIVLVE